MTELVHCKDHGCFRETTPSESGSFLYGLLRSVARLLAADTQGIEAANSILKLLGERAPGITLELISSRLAIKHFLSHCDGTGKMGGKKME